MSDLPINLTYENAPSRARRWMRRAIMPAVLIATVVVAIFFGPTAIRRFQVLSVQRRAMNYLPAADHVVYETNPDRAGLLMRNRGDYFALSSSGVPVIEFAATWRDFYRLAQPPGRKPAAVLFLHERRSPMGQRRLVAVDTLGSDSDGPLVFRAAVFRPGDAFAPPGILATCNWTQPLNDRAAGRIVRIYAGQCDPGDDTHFSITWQTSSGNETVDGWLLNDEQVAMELRKPLSSIGFH